MNNNYVKGTSDNLPIVDLEMLLEYISSKKSFQSAEMRGVKTLRSMREDYDDQAIGYVQLQRQSSICTVEAKICPEHKVRSKNYTMRIVINETDEKVITAECQDCAAALECTTSCENGNIEDILTPEEKLTVCPDCDERWPLSPGQLTCKICKRRASFECGRCQRRFTTVSSLYRHAGRKHGSRSYGCKRCTRTFGCRGDALHHRKTCGREPSHACRICCFKTRYKYNLRSHMQRMHKEAVEPFECLRCAAAFQTAAQLKGHLLDCLHGSCSLELLA